MNQQIKAHHNIPIKFNIDEVIAVQTESTDNSYLTTNYFLTLILNVHFSLMNWFKHTFVEELDKL